MTISYEIFNAEKHYEVVRQWFEAWNYPLIPADMLPEKGIIISVDDKLACCCWYMTDGSWGYMEGLISNKNLPDEDRGAARKFLIESIVKLAADRGCKFLNYDTAYPKVAINLESDGFVIGDVGLTRVVRSI